MKKVRIAVCAAAAALVGCGSGNEIEPAGRSAARLMDEDDVAGVLTTANTGEITMAMLAVDRAEDDDVESFARMLAEDHGRALARMRAVLHDGDIGIDDSRIAEDLRDDARRKLDMLREVDGNEFDALFLDQQIALHANLLSMLDQTLLPSVRDDRLEAELRRQREAVAQHLERARQLREGL